MCCVGFSNVVLKSLRAKYPEKVPFRLTRMLMRAMELNSMEGTFLSTCENVIRVLRSNVDSVLAVLEAFAHDPLIDWFVRGRNRTCIPRCPHSALEAQTTRSARSGSFINPTDNDDDEFGVAFTFPTECTQGRPR